MDARDIKITERTVKAVIMSTMLVSACYNQPPMMYSGKLKVNAEDYEYTIYKDAKLGLRDYRSIVSTMQQIGGVGKVLVEQENKKVSAVSSKRYYKGGGASVSQDSMVYVAGGSVLDMKSASMPAFTNAFPLLSRDNKATKFSPVMQIQIYMLANDVCRKVIIDRHKKPEGQRSNFFPKLSGVVEEDLSPLNQQQIAESLYDKVYAKVPFSPPKKREVIKEITAFLEESVITLKEKEAQKPAAEMLPEIQEVLSQVCTALMASASVAFY